MVVQLRLPPAFELLLFRGLFSYPGRHGHAHCCFEIVHTLRPDQEAIYWLIPPRRSPLLCMPHVSPFFLQLEPWQSLLVSP
jgi:hypothetical protein